MPLLACFVFHTLSRRGVRLPLNWVNVEWDSPSSESVRSEPPHQLSQRRRHQHLLRFHYSVLTQLTWSLTCVDLDDEECDSKSTESPPNVKKFKKVGEFKDKIENTQKPYYLVVWSVQKTRTKISCKCTFKDTLSRDSVDYFNWCIDAASWKKDKKYIFLMWQTYADKCGFTLWRNYRQSLKRLCHKF